MYPPQQTIYGETKYKKILLLDPYIYNDIFDIFIRYSML